MFIKEYRIPLPMSVDEYKVAQLYMIQKKSLQESTGSGSAVEIIENKPYENGPGGSGQYTKKIFHIGSHLPAWLKSLLPKTALRVEEEAWNAYPYTKTRHTCPFIEKFFIDIETYYLPDNGQTMINNDPYRLLHQWNIRHDKNLSAILKEKGIEAVKGSWSGFEINQLEENMKLYKEMNPEVEIYKVFYDRGSWPNRMILRETRFWDLLSFNLCRSLANIQSHITYLYQSKAGFKKGRYSKEEKAYLKELVKIHGKNWSLISNLMNREPTSLSITFHVHIKNHINKGSWHDEEKTRFFCIAERLMQYNKRNQLTIPKLNWSVKTLPKRIDLY